MQQFAPIIITSLASKISSQNKIQPKINHSGGIVTKSDRLQVHEVSDQSSSEMPVFIPSPLADKFRSSKYNIQQPYIQILEEGYKIQSDDQTETYHAVRPRKWFRNFLARGIGFLGLLGVFVGFSGLSIFYLDKLKFYGPNTIFYMLPLVVALSFALGFSTYLFIAKLLSSRREITLYDSNSKQSLISIKPSSGLFIFNHTYKLYDSSGVVLACFHKNVFKSILQIQWNCSDADGKYVFSATEDSIFMGLLRRYFALGKFIPLHFNFTKSLGKPFGQFIRRYSLRDAYTLSHNPKVAEGWLMVATGLLLDTGEER